MSQGPSPKNWRDRAAASAAGGGGSAQGSGRGKKLVGLLALLLALTGALVALLLHPVRMVQPEVLLVAVRENASPLMPPNPLAVQDTEILKKSFPADTVVRPYQIQDGAGVLRTFEDLRSKKDRPVVVYFSGLARASASEVYLLGGDADPEQKTAGVPLSKVLQLLRDCPAKDKLLILDIMRPLADARLGVLADDISQKTDNLLTRESEGNGLPFLVLCACSKGQLSQVSEELGMSAFAYYLDQGLRGHADGFGPHPNKDHRITVTELADFVKGRVDRWSWQNRALRQTPALWGSASDFALVLYDVAALSQPVELPKPPAYPAWLRDGWAARDKRKEAAAKLGPGLLRQLEAVLLRAERRWRGGIEERLQADVEIEAKRFENQVQAIVESLRMPPPRSVAMAMAGLDRKKVDPAFGRFVLRALLPKAIDPAVKLSEKDLAKKKEDLDKEINEVLAAFKKEPVQATQALVEAAATAPKLGPQQLGLVQQLLGGLEPNRQYIETLYLDRLRAFYDVVDRYGWDWSGPSAQQALRTTRAAESVMADIAQEPTWLPAVADLVSKADEKRLAGEKAFFKGTPIDWPMAVRGLQEAEELYAAAQLRLTGLRKARDAWDASMALLPRLGPALVALGTRDDLVENAWKGAVQATHAVGAALKDAKLDAAAVGNVEALRGHVADLQQYFADKVDGSLKLTSRAGGAEYRDIQALLESPLLTGPQREALWKAGQDLAVRLNENTQAADAADAADNQKKAATTGVLGTDRAVKDEVARRHWRTRVAIDLIYLAGYPQMDKLKEAFQAVADKTDDGRWDSLAGDLLAAWPVQIAEFKDSAGNLARADRLGRLLPPFDLAQARSDKLGHWSQNPALAVYRQARTGYWQWLSRRYRAESTAADPESALGTFLAAAAGDCARFAGD